MNRGDTVQIKKIYTDNPFIDSLLYFIKILAYGSVIKFQKEADSKETTTSMKYADLYIISCEGRGIFDLYTYSESLLSLSSVPKTKISQWASDNSLIEDQYKSELLKLAQQNFVDTYIETNEYYRMITGLPPVGDYGIPMKNYEYLIPEGNSLTDNATYVHEVGADGAQMLENYGILAQIRADYPDATYLDYMTCGITVYKARKAYGFQILYSPSCGVIEIDEKFASKYEVNRSMMVHSMYSDAMEIKSDYYDNFMAAISMMMTMSDMLTEVQEHIIKKDILDARCIEYIFSIYGIPYYHSIPLKYQTKMVKQVNQMVANKSCAQGMLNLIDIFGCKDIQVIKYYLLRDRQLDYWGNFMYNNTTITTSKDNDILEQKSVTVDVTDLTIPFPFDYYLEKGNVLFIRLDGVRVDPIDYQIYNQNSLKFLYGREKDHIKITYDFFYDKTTANKDFTPDTENGVILATETILPVSNTFEFHMPYPDYFNDGNELIVSIDSVFVNKNGYTLDLALNRITLDYTYRAKNQQVVLIYLYGKNNPTKFDKVDIVAFRDGQTNFTIPEPFKNYVQNGNCFFLTFGSTFLDSRRYYINNGQVILTDTGLKAGRALTFNFIYALDSVYTPIEIAHTSQVITATSYYQYEFTVKYPIENYLSAGYKIYVKLRGWFLSTDYFDLYKDKIVLRNAAMSLQPGDKIEVHFYYGPVLRNVVALHTFSEATTNLQDTFEVKYPVDDYFDKGNKFVVDIDGYPLSESEYSFSKDKLSITITNKDLLPTLGEKIDFTFVYNKESSQFIKIQQQTIIADSDGQSDFKLELPFYPYLETKQGFIVIYKSIMIDPANISVKDYTMTIKNIAIKKDEAVLVIYFYNNQYLLNKTDLIQVQQQTISLSKTINDDLLVQMPLPFDDFIENYWLFMVEFRNVVIPQTKFDIMNGGLLFVNPVDLLVYDELTFTFFYKNGYLIKTVEEDCALDIDLKFARIPLQAKKPLDYIKDKKTMRSYDGVTLADKFWDGEDNQDNAHASIKNAILKRNFNYARTKYMSVEYLLKLTDMSFEISYFYNMLYDDVFREDLLVVNIPSISPNKKFKLAYLFVYMTALAYNFSGVKDSIMETPTKIMYVKGFNFRADMAQLKEYISDRRRDFKDYDVFGFIEPSTQIPSFEEFTNIYKTNKNIYKTIIHGMYEARDYNIYSIWKKMYDSLMTLRFNLEFFKLSDGTVATTFSDFLKDKDYVLYKSLADIKAIEDKETRENSIVTMISDIVYILDQYLDTDEFKFIYSQFPGVSAEYLLQYLFTMINFFKSYKVILNEMNINMTIDDPDEENMRFHDKMAMTVNFPVGEYVKPQDKMAMNVTNKYNDEIGFREKIQFGYYYKPKS